LAFFQTPSKGRFGPKRGSIYTIITTLSTTSTIGISLSTTITITITITIIITVSISPPCVYADSANTTTNTIAPHSITNITAVIPRLLFGDALSLERVLTGEHSRLLHK
jgi:hypothetical protein